MDKKLFTKKLFTCGPESTTYEGYTSGEKWNGFDCPLFELEESLKIMKDFNDLNEELELNIKLVYDPDQDHFTEEDENYDEDEYVVYEPLLINTPDGTKKLYPIGTGYWTWEEN